MKQENTLFWISFMAGIIIGMALACSYFQTMEPTGEIPGFYKTQ